MKKTVLFCVGILMPALLCSGCLVAESKYTKKVDEANQLTQQIASLETQNKGLTEQVASLTGKVADLEADNAGLSESLDRAAKKTQEQEKASNTYQQLLKEMKSEIAQGQITIKELKGKLTMDVVDKILFASGEAKVKKEGLEVLDRVVEILKDVQDKNIRIEGHTDNVPIAGKLAKTYPTNWELSAARAINVSRYLQRQGIDPSVLSATAFGEYQPIADNTTPEGRAKNRRIAIILLPKD
ncbi:MAG: OmpA family protein [Deltaproteobacteria bacterium]|nr:OmpA family protein [Syntrophaceae bacterium]NLX52010.1 OmpA family protein [Deltaproteobacteria bacterium]